MPVDPADFGGVAVASGPSPEAYGAVRINQPEEAHGWGAFTAGAEASSGGLLERGRLPDIVLNREHATWYEKLLETAGQFVGDIPAMAAGGVAGALPGALARSPKAMQIGAGAGAMAVPTEIRTALMKAYSTGEAETGGDFLSRVGIAIKGLSDPEVQAATAKSALVGAATVGAGMWAGQFGKVAATAAETGTVAVLPAALDGRLPNKDDFINAAVMVAGPKAAAHVAGKIGEIYAKTGVEPEQVVAEAHRDPAVMEGLKSESPDLPSPFKEAAAEQTAKDVIPDPAANEQHALDLAAMIDRPYGIIPEEKLPNYENFKYVDTPEGAQAVSARASEVFEKQFEAARGSKTWDQTKEDAVKWLADRAASKGEDFVMPQSDDAIVGLAAKGMGIESLQQAAARMLADASEKVIADPSPENVQAQIAAVEMLKAWQATDLGSAAEIARALNARKAASQMRGLSKLAMEGFEKYRDDPVAFAKYIQGLRGDPQKIGAFIGMVKPASTLQKIQQYYRFSLLTGATVFQVKAVGDMMATMERLGNAALRVPGAVLGSGEVGARAAEFSAMVGAIGQGAKDGMRAMIDTWKATAEPRAVFGKDGTPNLADKITSIPHRIIESETDFFRALNERMEMNRQATSIAMKDGFAAGTDDFAQRVTRLLQAPTKEMYAAAEQAGAEATFTNKTSGLGKLLQDVSNNKYGEWGGFLVPFAKVPVNIAAWGLKDAPAIGLLMKGNREAWAAGGAARDGVIARQVIGGTVAMLTAQAVASGVLTGGGLSMSPGEHAARKAAGIQDYSIKVDGTWYSYERFQPLGLIASTAADLMEMHQQADQAYKADIVKMTGGVMAHAIISSPYFEGLHSFMTSLTEPGTQAPRRFDSFIGSFIPSFLAQAASSADPYKRQVDDLFDTIKQRLPVWRETLLPQINPLTGEPVENPRGLGLVETSTQKEDRVLTEAARLQVSLPTTPKSLQLPAMHQRDVGKVELTPEQQSQFAQTAGALSHGMLTSLLDSPGWEATPQPIQKQLFEQMITHARTVARAQVLSPNQRAAEMQRISDVLKNSLEK